MNWLKNLFSGLFNRKKNSEWDSLNYGKPSAANDELRDRNNV